MIAILKLLLLCLVLGVLIACNGKCKYKIFKESNSPIGTHRVVKFYNWCGYTSSNNINLSVLSKEDSVENRDKIFFVVASRVGSELDRDTTVFFRWLDDSTIVVEHNKDLIIIQKEDRQDNVNIKYREKP